MAVSMRATPKTALTRTSMVLLLDHLEAGGRAKGTITNARTTLTKFLAMLRGRPVSAAIIREFLESYPSVNTRGVKLIILRQWMRFLKKRGLIEEDPTADIPLPKKRRRTYLALSEEEFARLRAALPSDEMRVLATLLYYVGSRISETLALREEDIAFDETGDYGCVEFKQRKGGDAGFAAFGPDVSSVLRPYLRGQSGKLFSMEYHVAYKCLVSTARKVRIPGRMNPHRFRHQYITHAIENGWHQLALQQQVGHHDPASTAVYYHPTRNALIDIVRRANGAMPQPMPTPATTPAPQIASRPISITPLLDASEGTMVQIDRLRRFVDAVAATRLTPGESLATKRPWARKKVARSVTVILPVDGSVRASHARALMHLLEQMALQLEGGEAR